MAIVAKVWFIIDSGALFRGASMRLAEFVLLTRYADGIPEYRPSFESLCVVQRDEDIKVLAAHRHQQPLQGADANRALEHFWAAISQQICDGQRTKQLFQFTREAILAAVKVARKSAKPEDAIDRLLPGVGPDTTANKIVRDQARRVVARQLKKFIDDLFYM